MKRHTDNKSKGTETSDKPIDGDYEQNGKHFIEEKEVKPGEGILHHGRPLSEAEIEELMIHKENNRFLGITDTPEVGTGAGNVGGMIPDVNDMQESTDEIVDNGMRDSNFGRNYDAGNQSQDHFIIVHSEDKKKEKE